MHVNYRIWGKIFKIPFFFLHSVEQDFRHTENFAGGKVGSHGFYRISYNFQHDQWIKGNIMQNTDPALSVNMAAFKTAWDT